MTKFEVNEFRTAFDELGIVEGDNLLVHNSLLKFGIPKETKISRLPEIIYKDLEKAIGPSGTMAFPTFNFDFCSGIPYDRQKSPSKKMGVLSEYVRLLPQSKRSYHPIQPISVVGKNKDFITENDTVSSFSPEGPYDRLSQFNTKIIQLGVDINATSAIHLTEERFNVPYRYWKTFSGSYIDQGVETHRSYKMFVRSLEKDPKLRLEFIGKVLNEKGLIKKYKIGGSEVILFNLSDFLAITEECLSANPNFFVSNHPRFEMYEE